MFGSLLYEFTTEFINTAFGYKVAEGKNRLESAFSGNANSPEQQNLGNEPEF